MPLGMIIRGCRHLPEEEGRRCLPAALDVAAFFSPRSDPSRVREDGRDGRTGRASASGRRGGVEGTNENENENENEAEAAAAEGGEG